jgi:hypothetical protein
MGVGEFLDFRRDSRRRPAATRTWLAEAMQASWATPQALLPHRPLADLLGERHRIIANDWQSAGLNSRVAQYSGVPASFSTRSISRPLRSAPIPQPRAAH